MCGDLFANQLKVEDIRKSKNNYLSKKFLANTRITVHISYNILNISKKENALIKILMLSDFFLLSL